LSLENNYKSAKHIKQIVSFCKAFLILKVAKNSPWEPSKDDFLKKDEKELYAAWKSTKDFKFDFKEIESLDLGS
jgi:hypothetical protein